MLESLLKEYDLFHSSVISGGKVKFNINYLLDGNVYVSIVALINGDVKKASYDFVDDHEFKTFVLPKIIQRYLSKNVGLKTRKIMGGQDRGTLIIQRGDLRDCLIIRNCSNDLMELVNILISSIGEINKINGEKDSTIIFEADTHQLHESYMKYNVAFDYAVYKNQFFKNLESEDYDHSKVKKNGEDNGQDTEQLLLLNIARYAYTFDNVICDNVWDEILASYDGNVAVSQICNKFKELDYTVDSIYTNALILAEYEKNNDLFLHYNDNVVQEAIQACDNQVSLFNNSYMTYFKEREKYYASILDGEHQSICVDFIDAHDLEDETKKHVELKNRINGSVSSRHDKKLISDLKKIKSEKATFASIINDPLREEDLVENEVDKIFLDVDKEKIAADAEDQAKRIIEVELERDQLKKDAEEFAQIILKSEKEHKKILEAAEEQARKIFELEKENNELRKLAEDNARYLFERNQKLREEEDLREYVNSLPVKSQDIDKINNLLNSISMVKDLDFSVNHPTVMQELLFLEEKIITYLTTHTNVVHDEDVIVPIEKEEMLETKPVIELLSMIRNAYVSSHEFEKDGRHTVINFTPVDEDTFRVSLYSVEESNEDILMDAFFEEYQLTDNVLKELCDIFKTDRVLVASKIDNIPPDRADYLVIDNMNNAIKFMDCKRTLIDKVKEYL